MKTYIYKVIPNSDKKGFNREVVVYRVKNNKPSHIGYDNEINTASYKGDKAIACEIINKKDGHKLSKDGYSLQSNKIKLFKV